MKKIQMVDLKGQYEKIKDQVNASIQDVLENNTYINGPLVHQFQKNLEDYLGVKHVIPCANGTDALQIAMMGLGLKPGDEVITADFIYYRLRKPEYSEEERKSIAVRAKELLSQGKDLYLFFKHEDTPEGALYAEELASA